LYSGIQSVILAVIVLGYSGLGVAAILVIGRNKRRLAKLAPLVLLSVSLTWCSFALLASVRPDLSFQEFTTFLVLITVASYVFLVELPGFLILTEYDAKTLVILFDVRGLLVSMSYSFQDNLSQLKTKVAAGRERLDELNLAQLTDHFVRSSESMGNIDKNLYALVLNETTRAIERVSLASKHPFPKLLEVLSLSGLSFLIAQVLRLMG
jgi:hypothetical protein